MGCLPQPCSLQAVFENAVLFCISQLISAQAGLWHQLFSSMASQPHMSRCQACASFEMKSYLNFHGAFTCHDSHNHLHEMQVWFVDSSSNGLANLFKHKDVLHPHL